MYICMCEAVTDGQIRGVAESGITDFAELQAQTKVSTRCKKCLPSAEAIFAEAVALFKEGKIGNENCQFACVGCTINGEQTGKRERKKT